MIVHDFCDYRTSTTTQPPSSEDEGVSDYYYTSPSPFGTHQMRDDTALFDYPNPRALYSMAEEDPQLRQYQQDQFQQNLLQSTSSSSTGIKRPFEHFTTTFPGASLEDSQKSHNRTRKISPHSSATVRLLELIERYSGASLCHLVSSLRDYCATSVMTVDKVLGPLPINWKPNLPIPDNEWNTSELVTERQNFADCMLLGRPDWLFIGECCFNLHAFKTTNNNELNNSGDSTANSNSKKTLTLLPRGDRVSVFVALSPQGLVHSTISTRERSSGVWNKQRNFALFARDLSHLIRLDSFVALQICDSTPAWALQQHGFIEPLLVPPHSPFLSPLEYAFSDLKESVAKALPAPSSPEELLGVIHQALASITPEKAAKYYQQAERYWRRAFLGLPFQGKVLYPDEDYHAPRGDDSKPTSPSSSPSPSSSLSPAFSSSKPIFSLLVPPSPVSYPSPSPSSSSIPSQSYTSSASYPSYLSSPAATIYSSSSSSSSSPASPYTCFI